MSDPQPPPHPPELQGLSPADLLARGIQSEPSGGGPWQPPSPEELSHLLPQYRIESLLGRGGMGAVYRGLQEALDRPVAIKLLPAEVAADSDFVARFRREAKTLAKLQHPGIVNVFDFGQTREGHLYFVMEFVDGTDLQQILRGPGLDTAQALELITQICEALHYAHRMGVIHRDIKPANILITKDGRAKVADFGLARPTGEDASIITSTPQVMGTPAYMAPEQRLGHADHRSDIYALGIMLYEMLTGKRPAGIFDPPSVKVQVDVRLDQVVVKALQQEPERRYQEVSEMKQDVDSIRHTPPPAAVPNPARSLLRPLVYTVLAFVLLAVGTVVAWRWLSYAPPPAPKSSAATTLDLEGGLVGWWKGDGDARDSVGHHHGELRDGATFAPGRNRQAFSFNGSTSYVSVPGSDTWAFGSGDFSFALWANFTAIPPHEMAFIACDEGGGNRRKWIYFFHDAFFEWHSIGTGGLSIRSTEFKPELGRWYHLSLVRRGRRLHFYVDGAELSSAPWQNDVPQVNEALAFGNAEGTMPFSGKLDDVRIYNRALSALELPMICETRPSKSGATNGPAHWPNATKDHPFANSLGMKFVPVPITGGPTGGQRVLFSIWDTRVQDYEFFANETRRDWPKPDFEQGPTHPAVNVSWDDAQAFCTWLTEREHKAGKLAANERYRLPSDHEWSCAVGIGEREDAATQPIEKDMRIGDTYPWGAGYPPPKPSVGNYADSAFHEKLTGTWIEDYTDGYVNTSPVGCFPPNALGLYDTGGNVWQWCQDWLDANQTLRILRGASWATAAPGNLFSSHRGRNVVTKREEFTGFRCVLAARDN